MSNTPIYVTDFSGVDPTGGSDSTAGIAAAWAQASSQPRPCKLVFPPGIYEYTASPNFNTSFAEIAFEGQVILNYVGSGNAVVMDAGASGNGIYGLKFGWGNAPIVQAPASAQNGIYFRALLQGCKIGAQVNGAGTQYAGMRGEFGVGVLFDFTCSNNVQQNQTWFSKPANGLYLTGRNAGELTSYCKFINPLIEGAASSCAYLDWAQGNVFDGGSLEGSGSVGLFLTANAIKNKAIACDFEANADHDIYCLGSFNEFRGINSDKKTTFDGGAKFNKLIGGTFQDVLCTHATFGNLMDGGMVYNQYATSGLITDQSGTGQADHKNPRGKVHNAAASDIEGMVPSTISVSAGSSPFSYTNNSFNVQRVAVIGGLPTSISIAHGYQGVTGGLSTNNIYEMQPGDTLTISFGANGAPRVNVLI